MSHPTSISHLRRLERILGLDEIDCSMRDLFEVLRVRYLKETVPNQVRHTLERCGIAVPSLPETLLNHTVGALSHIQDSHKLNWGDVDFHLKYRVTDPRDLLWLLHGVPLDLNQLNRIIERGYILSVLPLNVLLPPEVVRQFIPPADFSSPHPCKSSDPYGIYVKSARLVSHATGLPLGSRKFIHSFLMDIEGWCPIGCSDCYKSYYTRERGHDLGVSRKTLKEQTRALVAWMNQHPKVYDIIISGGEPLTISNSELKWMLAEFKKAKFLKVLRICTGTLFLGLPFRFDDGLLDALTEFSASTGVRVTFNTHLSTYYQMTPEAVFATWRARDRGFSIYSQVPIREGLNFFSDNVDRTIEVWRRLGELQLLCNVEPYKFIIDMHPRTLAYYVPIECAIKVWGMVCESHEQPELQRPRTLSIFSRQGNIILSGHTLFAMRKDVNRKRKTVTYWIPKTHSPGVYRPGRKMQYFRYDEPLMESRNDNPNSLEELAARWFTSG